MIQTTSAYRDKRDWQKKESMSTVLQPAMKHQILMKCLLQISGEVFFILDAFEMNMK